MVKVPRAVEFTVPLPEPLPKVDILFGPRDPAEIVSNFVLLVLLRQNLTHSIHEGWAIAVVKRPNGIPVVRIIFTLQEVVDVTGPFIVFALASGVVPIVPILPAQECLIDVVVPVATLAITARVLVVDPVLIIVVGVVVIVIVVAVPVPRIVIAVIVAVVGGVIVRVLLVGSVSIVVAAVEIGRLVVIIIGAIVLAIVIVIGALVRIIVIVVVVRVVVCGQVAPVVRFFRAIGVPGATVVRDIGLAYLAKRQNCHQPSCFSCAVNCAKFKTWVSFSHPKPPQSILFILNLSNNLS